MSYRAYYLLGIKINNCLKLDKDHRTEANGVQFLVEVENEYKTLFNDSLVNNREIEDKLLIINKNVFSNPILNGVPNHKLFVKTSSGNESKDTTI
jgi:hypothetical protein